MPNTETTCTYKRNAQIGFISSIEHQGLLKVAFVSCRWKNRGCQKQVKKRKNSIHKVPASRAREWVWPKQLPDETKKIRSGCEFGPHRETGQGLVPESKNEVEKSARWNATKEINELGSNGISNLLNYGAILMKLIISRTDLSFFQMSQPLGVKV